MRSNALYVAQRQIDQLGRLKGLISDGSHTFEELYYHRDVLFLTILKANLDKAWKSKLHADGTMYEGYFIAGIYTPTGLFTYHTPMSMWKSFEVIPELPKAPDWDGHVSSDVVRLLSL